MWWGLPMCIMQRIEAHPAPSVCSMHQTRPKLQWIKTQRPDNNAGWKKNNNPWHQNTLDVQRFSCGSRRRQDNRCFQPKKMLFRLRIQTWFWKNKMNWNQIQHSTLVESCSLLSLPSRTVNTKCTDASALISDNLVYRLRPLQPVW